MTPKSLRLWSLIHKWTSLLCTLFLLVICLTGLPLIFRDEIGNWLNTDPPYANLAPNAPRANLDRVVETTNARYPRETIRSLFIDDDEPQIVVGVAPKPNALPNQVHWMKFDARTADLLVERPAADKRPVTFLSLMLNLHTDLFAGLSGNLFLAFMGLSFVGAIVSGVVLYAPFMRRLEFGAVRSERSRRIKWLDLHNLLGVVTIAWGLIVGLTGIVNELSVPLFKLWQSTDVPKLLRAYHDSGAPQHLASAEAVFATVQKRLPGQFISSVVFPGPGPFSTPHHYIVWTKGDRPLTSRLFAPVLVDAETGHVTAVVNLPFYLKALEISRPLHFGDYGGMPLKIIWGLLDLITIVVLGSGLYLWIGKGKTKAKLQGETSDASDAAALLSEAVE